MKKLLIISPHWPPSNLAGVHRARLISNFLPEFGWAPTVLTVDPDFYEEAPDPELTKTIADHVDVRFANAFRASRRLRVVGDIGLRGFLQLRSQAAELLRQEEFDFVWIPIPSFYAALIGRVLHYQTGVPYGIDYIDPWVRPLHPSQRRFSRAGLSLLLARLLEPVAVRRASLISGVAKAYYLPVLERNFRNRPVVDVAMPYGFDPRDHQIDPDDLSLPWDPAVVRAWVYAGAFLPNSFLFYQVLFEAIASLRQLKKWPPEIHLYFIGTGNYPGEGIESAARQHGVDDIVHESRDRIPFLRVQHLLRHADRTLIIGSTDRHYTASKTFQCALSRRPVFAMLHAESTAAAFLAESCADTYAWLFGESPSRCDLLTSLQDCLERCAELAQGWNPDLSKLAPYSSRESARMLVDALNRVLNDRDQG